MAGVVKADFDQVGTESATETVHGWGLFVEDGRLKHNNAYSNWPSVHAPAEQMGGRRYYGDGVSPVGLLLDLGAGSLAVCQVRSRC